MNKNLLYICKIIDQTTKNITKQSLNHFKAREKEEENHRFSCDGLTPKTGGQKSVRGTAK